MRGCTPTLGVPGEKSLPDYLPEDPADLYHPKTSWKVLRCSLHQLKPPNEALWKPMDVDIARRSNPGTPHEGAKSVTPAVTLKIRLADPSQTQSVT